MKFFQPYKAKRVHLALVWASVQYWDSANSRQWRTHDNKVPAAIKGVAFSVWNNPRLFHWAKSFKHGQKNNVSLPHWNHLLNQPTRQIVLCGLNQQRDNMTTGLNEISYGVKPGFECLFSEMKWKKIVFKIIYRTLQAVSHLRLQNFT